MRTSKRRACAVGLILAAAAFSPGCSERGPCLPAPLAVNPSRAAAGSAVVVSSPPAQCAIAYPQGTTYALTLRPDGGDPARQTTVPVAADGAFSANVDIPADFPTGPATVLVTGSTMDRCAQDTPPGVSCAAYQVALTITG